MNISMEVRGGLFIRQVHHWAALLLVASMIAHMMRTFFTGPFRRPRESNWALGVRMWPPWELYILGYTVPAIFFPAVIGVRTTHRPARCLPVIERFLTKDTAHHNLLQRPRDAPARTATGMVAMVLYTCTSSGSRTGSSSKCSSRSPVSTPRVIPDGCRTRRHPCRGRRTISVSPASPCGVGGSGPTRPTSRSAAPARAGRRPLGGRPHELAGRPDAGRPRDVQD
ncbi:hypothetical protein GCM10023199_11020 [Actinomycetospora chibensis]